VNAPAGCVKSSGKPSESSSGPTVLASANVAASQIGTIRNWISFDFADVAVSANQQLALVLTSATSNGREYQWYGDLAWPQFGLGAGTYAGGRAYAEGLSGATWGDVLLCNSTCNSPDAVDFGFRSYVEPAPPAAAGAPEPAAWAMMLMGCAALGTILRRRSPARA